MKVFLKKMSKKTTFLKKIRFLFGDFLLSLFRIKMITTDNKKVATKKFHCKECNYTTSKKSDYDKHILTAKHKKITMNLKKSPKSLQSLLVCECGKKYKHHSGLSRHKKQCTVILNIENNVEEEKIEENNDVLVNEDNNVYKDLLMDAMKTMKDQQEQINKMIPLIGSNNNNTMTTNNFNLNLFLNETCKDALNLTDFINSLQVQLKDLEYTTDNGHVKGITNIFHNALSNIEVNKRPMHCTDLKREVLYIKDNNEWQIDDEKDKLKEAVETVTNKNISNTSKWLEKYPEHTDPNSKDFDKYMRFTSNCMGTGEESEQNKIMKNIMKDVTIKKE